MAFLPDDEGILITERPGRLLFLNNRDTKEVSGLPEIAPGGQGGLLDIIADNDFQTNRFIYFSYTEPGPGGYSTAAARAEFRNLQLDNLRVIFSADPKSRGTIHFGSRLLMAPSIAPSGMTFYNGSLLPLWRGDLFVGALAGKHLRRIVLDKNGVVRQQILLENEIGKIRDVAAGPDGALYLLTDERRGKRYWMTPYR